MGEAPSKRFTRDGGSEVESWLAKNCREVVEGVGRIVPEERLEGVVLGGGYGRGEGGVLREAGREAPYNDMEFYVFVRGSALLAERAFREPLRHLGHSLSPRAGLEVEFKVLSIDKLRRSRPSMFYYDLVAGHQVVSGGEGLFEGCRHHLAPEKIPTHEATRLLMNRCSGLLFSALKLQARPFEEEESDFVGRNLAKARLAFGDVLLTALGLYHWSCIERHSRLRGLSGRPEFALDPSRAELVELIRCHGEGVEFKLHPTREKGSADKFAKEHRLISEIGRRLWLWLEGYRLGCAFTNTADYVAWTGDKCPETNRMRNLLINLRAFGLNGGGLLESTRYPRERLLNALCILLWSSPTVQEGGRKLSIEEIGFLRRELKATAATNDFAGLVGAYEAIWSRFN